MSRASDAFHNFYHLQLDALIDSLIAWPNSGHYVDKLRKLRTKNVEKGLQMFDANSDHFNTLNHGDFWLNNIMVKLKPPDIGAEATSSNNTNSTVENVIFIYFQDSCWTSPAIDLHYFLNTSLCESCRPTAFDQLIDVYYTQLVLTLKRLNYCKSIPTQHKFREQFMARNFYGTNTEFIDFFLFGFDVIFSDFSIQASLRRVRFNHL